jgi:hypothetical protein
MGSNNDSKGQFGKKIKKKNNCSIFSATYGKLLKKKGNIENVSKIRKKINMDEKPRK